MSNPGVAMTGVRADNTAQTPPPAAIVAPPAPKNTIQVPQLALPSDENSALAQYGNFAAAGLSAEVDAAQKNNVVLQQAQQAQSDTYNSMLTAYDNLHKIERLGGPGSFVNHIVGLFDSDYNAEYQRISVQEAQVRNEAISAQAKSQMDINAAIPSLIEKQTGIADKLLAGKIQTDKYALDVHSAWLGDQNLAVENKRLGLEAAKTRTEMDADQRAQAEFNIGQLGEVDTQSAINDANTNPKSKWRPILGMLQKHLSDSEMAQASATNMQASASKGDMEAHDMYQQQMANHLPLAQLVQGYQTAQAKGDSIVTYGAGANAVQLPITTVINAIHQQKISQDQADQDIAIQAAQEADLGPRTNRIITAAQGMASVDPRAANEAKSLAAQVTALGSNPTYQQITNYKAILDAHDARVKQIGADIASNFKSSDAKGAVTQFAQTGQFNATGAQAVLGDSLGNASLSRTTKYAPAFSIFNNAIASQLKQSSLSGGGLLQPQGGQMDEATMMQILTANKSNPKFNAVVDGVLSDPQLQTQAANAVKSTIQADSLRQTISALGQSKSAAPFWQGLVQNPDQIMTNGAIDANKLAQEIEKQSAMTGGKVDYQKAFIAQLRQTGTGADNYANSDPRYTLYDHALENYLFGAKPHSAVVGNLVSSYQQVAAKLHADMMSKINQDRTGQTVQQAVGNALSQNPDMPISTGMESGANQRAIINGTNAGNTKSATGLPLTVQQINSLYGGGAGKQ